MNDPEPGSTEAMLVKASWPLVVVGCAVFVAAKYSETAREERVERVLAMKDDLDAGRLKLRPGTETSLREVVGRIEKKEAYDEYSAAMCSGFIAICLGVFFSLYASKLRKKRTGE
jgi:hypothetical protein